MRLTALLAAAADPDDLDPGAGADEVLVEEQSKLFSAARVANVHGGYSCVRV